MDCAIDWANSGFSSPTQTYSRLPQTSLKMKDSSGSPRVCEYATPVGVGLEACAAPLRGIQRYGHALMLSFADRHHDLQGLRLHVPRAEGTGTMVPQSIERYRNSG